MSTGGYKLSKFQWTGTGTNTWYGEEGAVTEEQRLARVLSGVVEMICSNSSGWQMDTRYHSTVSDYTPSSVTMFTYPYRYYGASSDIILYNKICFLTNDNLYLAIGISSGPAKLKNDDLNFKAVYTKYSSASYYGYNNAIIGLYFSVSTSGDWDTTSSDATSEYGVTLPTDATKWASFGRFDAYSAYSSSAHYNNNNFVRDNIANRIYSYYFLTKENQFALFEKCDAWGANVIKCIIAGDLIGSFAHTSDTKGLCCISLSENNTSEPSSQNSDRGETTAPVSSIDYDYYINQESYYIIRYASSNSNTQFFRADGTQPNPYNSSTHTGAGLRVSNEVQLSTSISNPILGGTRWCPIQLYISSNDPVSYGVVENDGFKGYLSTDFIRAVTIGQYNLGSTFGVSHDFIYIGGGIALGWDSSNTESLF